MSSFEINDVDWFTAGTVGPKGERIFFLQAQAGAEIVSLKLEKQQVQAVADFLVELLADAHVGPGEVGPPAELAHRPAQHPASDHPGGYEVDRDS